MLQLEHGVGVEQVVLALAAPLVLAADLELAVRTLVGAVQVGQRVAGGHVVGDVVEVDAADAGSAVPVKYSSSTCWLMPMAWNSWAPV